MAILVTLGAALAVAAVQAAFSSLSTFFATVLASAGFFLVVEFFLDSTTAVVFLWRGHKFQPQTNEGQVHKHILMRIGSTIGSVMFAAVIVGFFVYGPRSIGHSIDIILAILLIGGIAFAFTSRRDAETFIFEGLDLELLPPPKDSVVECRTPVEVN